jgi:GntR family transcriptional regulator
MINNSPLPLYAQLKEAIIDAIAHGELAPGDQLPSHRQLCKQYDMSHMTVRRAISELTIEGVVQSIPGKGLYVAQKTQPADTEPLLGHEQQMARLGLAPSTKMLEAKIVNASTVLAQSLQVAAGAPLVYLYRLRLADNKPMSLTSVYLPHALCPNLLEHDLENDSLFTTLRNVYGLTLASSTSTVSAVLADNAQAKLLDMSLPAALLFKEQFTYLDTGQVIEISRTFIRGDGFHIHIAEGNRPSPELSFATTLPEINTNMQPKGDD